MKAMEFTTALMRELTRLLADSERDFKIVSNVPIEVRITPDIIEGGFDPDEQNNEDQWFEIDSIEYQEEAPGFKEMIIVNLGVRVL